MILWLITNGLLTCPTYFRLSTAILLCSLFQSLLTIHKQIGYQAEDAYSSTLHKVWSLKFFAGYNTIIKVKLKPSLQTAQQSSIHNFNTFFCITLGKDPDLSTRGETTQQHRPHYHHASDLTKAMLFFTFTPPTPHTDAHSATHASLF